MSTWDDKPNDYAHAVRWLEAKGGGEMSDDDAERRALAAKPIPARPKSMRPSGAAALDDLISKRKAAPAKLEFLPEQPEQQEQNPASEIAVYQPNLNYDAFHSFRLILKTLNKYPKATQLEMISLLNELLVK